MAQKISKELKNKDLEIEQLKKQVAELSKFKHERKGGNKRDTLDQISTPAHISDFMKELVFKDRVEETKTQDRKLDVIIDIAVGAGSLLIPWKETGALLIGSDIDEEALNICKENIPNNLILFKHDALICDTPCKEPEHLFFVGENTSLEKMWEHLRIVDEKNQGERIYVMNPPFSKNNASKFLLRAMDLMKASNNTEREREREREREQTLNHGK